MINFLGRYSQPDFWERSFGLALFRAKVLGHLCSGQCLLVDNCQECFRRGQRENACTKNLTEKIFGKHFLFIDRTEMSFKFYLMTHDSLFYVLWGEGSGVSLLDLFFGVAEEAHHKKFDRARNQNWNCRCHFPYFFVRLQTNMNF